MGRLKLYFFLLVAVFSSQCSAADWVLLHNDPDATIEWDRGNIHDQDGRKAVRKRISWKQEKVMDSGIRFKFSMQLVLYSCTDKTESIVAVSNFSADRKLVYKGSVGPIVQRSQSYKDHHDYNGVERMLKNVC